MNDSPPRSRLRVLLVHESRHVLQRVDALVQRLPHCMLAAVTDRPAVARRMLDDGGIDAVVTGLRLRDGAGFELLPGRHTDDTPVIVLSRRMRPEDQRRAVSMGAQSYLSTHDLHALAEILETLAIERTTTRMPVPTS